MASIIEKEKFIEFLNKMKKFNIPKFMHLAIYINMSDDYDEELLNKYIEHAFEHNEKISSSEFYDAGFDVLLPNHTEFNCRLGNKVDFKIQCSATVYSTESEEQLQKTRSPFYTYCRSSISKTPLRLSNQQGIIDAGYRGNLIGMFDCFNGPTHHRLCGYTYKEELYESYKCNKYTRLIQICAPNLMPIFVEIVPTFDDLGPSTERGVKGVGSTGV
jgi:dUTP pyrophosphatase